MRAASRRVGKKGERLAGWVGIVADREEVAPLAMGEVDLRCVAMLEAYLFAMMIGAHRGEDMRVSQGGQRAEAMKEVAFDDCCGWAESLGGDDVV